MTGAPTAADPLPEPLAAVETRGGVLTMFSPVAAVVRRDAFTVPLEATIRQTLGGMDAARTGVVVVVDPGGRIPLGIFTLEDVVRRVTLSGTSLDDPVATVMTSGLVTIAPHATAHQAILTMARHAVRHLVVVDAAGALVGILSREALLTLERVALVEVGEQIQAATDLPELQAAAGGIRRLVAALLARRVHVELLTHFISTLDDLLTVRLVEVVADRFDLPPVPFCWIALGSEGRLEQTFATDQDNGIVFDAAEDEAEALRARFLPFARAVNEALASCGFPLCKGEVMASNPRWCLTVGEWQRTFSRWLDVPEPEAILHASIFFDLRPVYGRAELAGRLWEWLLPRARGAPLFLALLARAALAHRPPLGRIRDFVFDASKEFPGTLDLKAFGSHLFVEAARVFALALGVPHTNTAERLRAAAEAAALDRRDAATMVEAFHFLHLLRLRNQVERGAGALGANRVDPSLLNELDRAVLKEALRQLRKLQGRIALDYRIEAFG